LSESQAADKLEQYLRRVKSWPEAARKEAASALFEIEEDFIGLDRTNELNLSRAQAQRGEGISLADLKKDLDL